MKKLYESLSLTLAFWLMVVSVSMAQVKVVSGTVTDESGSGIPGVNIVVTGTTQGTINDLDGKYIVEVPQGTFA